MKGDNITNQLAVYGTQGVSSPTNKPPATYEGTEWKDFSGNFWFYDNNNLWKFNPTTLEWTWIKGTQSVQSYGVYGTKGVPSPLNHPGYRAACSASWVDNIGNLWLFGGQGYNGYKNDLWKYNVSTNEWTWVKGDSTGNNIPQFGTKGISSAINNPGGLFETNATWVDSNNNLWLFGGASGSGICWNTLWKYNIISNQWTWMSGDNFSNAPAIYGIKGISNINNKPSARLCYSKWIKNDTLWLFGGESYGGLNNDLWRYSISSNTWTWMSGSVSLNKKGLYFSKCEPSINIYPSSRLESRSCWKDMNGIFWLFGGFGYGGCLNDLWTYNSNTNKWAWVNGDSIPNTPAPNYGSIQVPSPANNPGGRGGVVSWVDGFNDLWIFGGTDLVGSLNDLWKYDVDESCNGLFIGIKEFDYTANFFIYPIPFNETLSIEFDFDNSSPIQITLRNIQGQIIKTISDNSTSKKHKIKLDIKELNLLNGIYVLDIISNQKTVTRKVIKLDK